MSSGLRDRQLTICQPVTPALQVVDGLPRRRYTPQPPVWGRIDPPTGWELTQGLGADHRIDGVLLLHQDVPVSRSAVIRDEDAVIWEVRAVQQRRASMEQQVYLQRSDTPKLYTILDTVES